MAKTPGNLEQPKLVSGAEREARKAFRQVDFKAALTEHETSEQAFSDNRKRLRSERLAPELPDDTPLDRVRLSSRIRNALSAAGWKTVGEVRGATDETLLSLQDLGKGSVSHLRETLGLPSTDGVRVVGS
jgi:DNA-directed RNA polymerase alpha subunit